MKNPHLDHGVEAADVALGAVAPVQPRHQGLRGLRKGRKKYFYPPLNKQITIETEYL